MTQAWALLTRPLADATMRVALRGGTFALAGTFVGRIANVGALLVAANLLGSEQFGALSLALSTTLVITSVSALGLPVTAQKLVAEARKVDVARRDRLIDLTLVIAAAVGVCTMAGAVLASGWVASAVLGRPEVASLVAIASVMILTTPMVEVIAGLLAALENFAALGAFRAVHGCLCGAVLAVVLLGSPAAGTALWALAAAEALACVIGFRFVLAARGPRSPDGVDRRRLLNEMRPLVKVALPALVASVSLQPALWLGQVLLSRQPDGLDHVGTFAVAMRWHAIALFVPATMGSVLLPMLGRLTATGRGSDARALFIRYGGLTLAFSTATCLVLVTLAVPIMGLQGPEYAMASGVLLVLALATVPAALNNVLSNRALAEGRLALWVWSDLALSLTLAGCAVILIPALDGVGLAVAYLAAYVATCLVLLPIALAARSPEMEPACER
jgi:O-antigen/teichoic acid export membrane protein